MEYTYRPGMVSDVAHLKELGIKSWRRFESRLTPENWQKLYTGLSSEKTYSDLLDQSDSIICTTDDNTIIGMAFLVPNGNPTEIYEKEWSYIRFVTVDPDFSGQGIGRKLTVMCIDKARQNNEHIIALHTSELMSTARHIYESLGFTILREIDRRLGIQYWLYTLELNKKE